MRGWAMIVAASLMLAAPAAHAAEAAAQSDFISAADIAALAAKAKAERKEGQPTLSQRLLQIPGHAANLEYRAAVGPASVHFKDAEFFYVVDGSATLTTGGKLTGETKPNPDNLSGTGIEGGQSRKVAKGDFFVVPEGVPHWFSAIDGTVVLISLHVQKN